MKVFKRTALLISVIVLAVVLSIGAIAGAALLAEGDATLGEKYSAVQVTTDGKVNLKVYYSELGTAQGFVAQVIDPATDRVEKTYNYTKAELGEATANGYCVKVPLTASQMTHIVSIKAVAGDTESTERTFTVANYAQQVLALTDAENAKFHDAMRALLNWGAMAQTRFEDATGSLANVNVFARGTNPLSVVNANTIATPDRVIDSAFKSVNVELSEGTIAMNFTVELPGATSPTASYTKGEGDSITDPQTLVVTHVSGDTYKVSIRNISVNNFNKLYTVTVNDGTNDHVANYKLFDYIDYIVTDENGAYDDAQKNVVRAMYQFYQAATGDTGADTCEHGNGSTTYWVAADADTQYVKCSYCHANVGHQAISNGVNMYLPASAIQYGGKSGHMDVSVLKDGDGTQYVRLTNFIANKHNYGDINVSGAFTGKTGATGQYLVVKYRVGATGNGTDFGRIDLYTNTDKGSVADPSAEGEVFFVEADDNQWHTVVINLAERVNDNTKAFVDNGDGTYNMDYLSFRPFKSYAATNVTEAGATDPARSAYTYTTSKGDLTVYGAPLSDEEIEANGYTLKSILETTKVPADAYVDFAYMAVCDSLDKAKTLIDTSEYEWSMTDTLSAYRKTADDSCARHQNAVSSATTETATVYTAACQACGAVSATQTVPNTVNYFADYSSMGIYNGSVATNQIEDGVIFNRFTSKGSYVKISNSSTAYGSLTTSQYQTGKYVTFKYRWVDSKSYLQVHIATGDKKSGNTAATHGELRTAEAVQNEWRVVIADVSGNSQWTSDGSLQKIYGMFSTGTGTFDVAYFAVVDSYAEAASLMGANDKYMYDYGTDFNSADKTPIVRNNKGECPHESISVTPVVGETATVYTAACKCGEVFATQTVPNTVNYFADYTGMHQYSATITENLYEDGVIFNRFTTKGSYALITGGTGAGSATTSKYQTGKYVTFKYRWVDSKSYIAVHLATGDKKTSNTGATHGELATAQAVQNEWRVVIADVSGNAQWTSDGSMQSIYAMLEVGTGTLDVAYFAVVDSYAEAASLMGANDKYMYDYGTDFNSANKTPILRNNKGECPHQNISETVSGNTYTYSCTGCGYSKTVTVDASVNYYSGLANMGIYTNGGTTLDKLKLDPETGIIYNAFGATQGTHWNFTGGKEAGTYTTATYKAGEYLVIKYRASGEANAMLNVRVGTGDTGKKTGWSATGVGQFTAKVGDGWRVGIVKIENKATYTVGAEQQLYFSAMPEGDRHMDIAFVAVVDSVDEMLTLLGDGETYLDYGNSFSNTPVEKNQDGTAVVAD